MPARGYLEEAKGEHAGNDRRLAKLMIAKGIITDEEFKSQLIAERANLSRGPVALNEAG